MIKTLGEFYNVFSNKTNILSQFIPEKVVPSVAKSHVDLYIKNRFSRRRLSFYGVHLSLTDFVTMSSGLQYLLNEKFGVKWNKLISLEEIEYNPLKPFNIELSETTTDTFKTVKDITTSSGRDETYAYNSENPTPTDSSNGETTKEYERENPRTREYTRVGNIGNTSMQDLVKQEREVANWVILDIIIEDIISVVCRKTYDL